jgi:hypothetical protein
MAGIMVILGLGFSILAAMAAAMFYLGASWTERQVRLGASIATTTQQIDHTTDERKVVALAQMARFAFQAGQKSRRGGSLAPAQPLPILPPPAASEGTSAWLPPLTNFREEFTGQLSLDATEPD